jgi:hypothetical protein
MKKIFGFLVALAMSISLSSCITAVSAQDDRYNGEVDASVVVSYGTPVLNTDGLIIYYVYRDWYYYPYYIDNRYYFHRYRRVLPPNDFSRRYKPIPRERFHPRPHHRPHVVPPRPNHHHHGSGMNNRPYNAQRSSTRGGHLGRKR